jgi:hypothetical protein
VCYILYSLCILYNQLFTIPAGVGVMACASVAFLHNLIRYALVAPDNYLRSANYSSVFIPPHGLSFIFTHIVFPFLYKRFDEVYHFSRVCILRHLISGLFIRIKPPNTLAVLSALSNQHYRLCRAHHWSRTHTHTHTHTRTNTHRSIHAHL